MKIRIQSNLGIYIIIFIFILFDLFLLNSIARAGENEYIEAKNIANEIKSGMLSPDGIYNKDNIEKYNKLISKSSYIIPGIIYLLERSDSEDPMVIIGVLNIVGQIKESGADVSLILPLIRGLINKERMKDHAIGILGVVGTKEDIQRLLKYLSDKKGHTRFTAAEALGYIADDEKTADEIEKILDMRIKNEVGLEIKKDITFKNGYMAANKIRIKAFKKKVINEKDQKIKADLNSRIIDLEDEKKEWEKWKINMDFPKHKHSQGQSK